MSEGPTWRVTDPAKPYHDERFDEPWMADPIKIGVDHPHYKPPLDPQQPTPEQIADAAREALADMQLVLRIWPYGPLSPLTGMKALVTLLTPPAPKWTATEAEE